MDHHSLELRREAEGLRYYLHGEPIHAGDMLELQLDDGSWARGRYEYQYEYYSSDPDQIRAYLHIAEATVKALSADSVLRWPESSHRRF